MSKRTAKTEPSQKYIAKVRLRFRLPPEQQRASGKKHLDVEAGQEFFLGPEDAGVNIGTLLKLGFAEKVDHNGT